MSGFIVEYVGRDGIRTTSLRHRVHEKPKPGDIVLWPDGTKGRIDQVETGFCEPGQAHVCVRGGSVFLGDGYVSISGGPFTIIELEDLQWQYACEAASFWNWGNNSPGADMGVDYLLIRPVWVYVGDSIRAGEYPLPTEHTS